MKKNANFLNKVMALFGLAVLGISPLWGQAAGAAPAASQMITGADLVPWVMTFTAVALAVVAVVLGSLLMRIAILKTKNGGVLDLVEKSTPSTITPLEDPNALPSYVVPIVKSIVVLFLALGMPGMAWAQEAAAAAADAATAAAPQPIDWTITGDRLNFLILAVIFFELLVIAYFAYWLKTLLVPAKEKSAATAVAKTNAWWDRFNKSVDIDHEKDVQLDHDYDGIKELDNALPPWWLYGFYFTILFAGVYIYRYHVSGSAPLQVEELNIATVQAEKDLAAVMATMANKVDENTIEYKADPALIEEGKGIFAQNCKSCHGEQAQGASIGPNLTDVYWIHGGNIKDIFKTIKNGVQEKGMISWSQTLSPKQIAAVATFVKSLQGSNPPNPRAPQGNEYKDDQAAPADTAAAGSVTVSKLQ